MWCFLFRRRLILCLAVTTIFALSSLHTESAEADVNVNTDAREEAFSANSAEQDSRGAADTVEPADQQPSAFVATSEWSEIKPGQSIPRGLHVRINMQTGLKEAKLMDADSAQASSSSSSSLTLSAAEQELEHNFEPLSPNAIRYAELERALRDVATSHDEPGLRSGKSGLAINQAYKDTIKQKYRSIDEIKEEFEAANVNVKMDAEIINDLLKEFRRPDISEAHLLTILEDLEYYLHQIDNAVYFSQVGGVSEVLRLLNRSLDHTGSVSGTKLLSALTQALGAACHSNPKVQVASYKQGTISLLLRILTSLQLFHGRHAEGSLEEAMSVEAALSSTLYSLAALLRRFPTAQRSFVDLGGLASLVGILKRSEYTTSTGKIEAKIATLIDDLLAEEQGNTVPLSDGRLPLSLQLLDSGWCENIAELLPRVSDHRHREKILLAMKASLPGCGIRFATLATGASLQKLSAEYERLASEEAAIDGSEDSYYHSLLETVRSVTNAYSTYSSKKDEL